MTQGRRSIPSGDRKATRLVEIGRDHYAFEPDVCAGARQGRSCDWGQQAPVRANLVRSLCQRLGLNSLVSRAYSAASYAGGPSVEIVVVSHGLGPSGRGVRRTPTVHG